MCIALGGSVRTQVSDGQPLDSGGGADGRRRLEGAHRGHGAVLRNRQGLWFRV